MRLYLIRHAVTAETGRKLSGRIAGIPLSPEGRDMATAIAEHLSPVSFKAIYTSPIERCQETAGALAAGRPIRPRIDKAFMEADYGRWSGRPLKSLYKLKAWGNLMTSASRFRFPEGETLAEVQARAVAGVERLATEHRDSPVALASHADVIRTILVHYLGAPLDLIHRLDVLPASVSIVDLYPSGAVRVPVLNHIADPGRWR
ncbi:MAG: histidine phosphatase family protein [Actinomycetota bacterium]|nr:histidine phosphatase family protein [Actinomycetota bacterium]